MPLVQLHRSWRGWVAECAKQEHAAFIDLADLIGRDYATLPMAKVESFFADKGTHTNSVGAMFSARIVVSALRAIPSSPLDAYLSETRREVTAASTGR